MDTDTPATTQAIKYVLHVGLCYLIGAALIELALLVLPIREYLNTSLGNVSIYHFLGLLIGTALVVALGKRAGAQ
ncbi:hypothetical protein ACIGGE_10545 [Qipengyuania sp. NPDC077410]|uniref:hypothetical protein n=1 Tax=Qipengyuania sp. NPDC077410 TaxID=3364496 RepID=UPI0037C5F5BC